MIKRVALAWVLLLLCCGPGRAEVSAISLQAQGLTLDELRYVDVWVVEAKDTQGQTVTCAALRADRRQLGVRADLRSRPLYSGAPSEAHVKVPPGKNLLFVVEAYREDLGTGDRAGLACIENVTLSDGQKKTLDLVIEPIAG